MNVIYISYDGMTDALGQSQVIPYLIGLAEKGHTIRIVSCEKKERFKNKKDNVQELLNNHGISWHPVLYSALPSVIGKQKNLFFLKQKATQLCKANLPDIVHCRSYMAALIGIHLKKIYSIKFIFDMRGFWADERIDGQIWSLKNRLHKRIYDYFKKKEKEFLLNADYTISLTNNAKNEILSWSPFKEKKIPINVIPCCVDLKLFSPTTIKTLEQQQIKKNLNIHASDFIISYLGSIGTWYMLDEMLDFFKLLLLQKKEAKFLFITPDDKEQIISKALKKGIPIEKLIVISANRSEVPLYLSLSQVSIYFIKPLYSKKASSPTKTGEIMAMGIPIITNSGIGDSDEMIYNSGAGMIVNDFSEKEYERIISKIDVLLEIDKVKITEASKHYFSLENGVRLYEEVYKSLE